MIISESAGEKKKKTCAKGTKFKLCLGAQSEEGCLLGS